MATKLAIYLSMSEAAAVLGEIDDDKVLLKKIYQQGDRQALLRSASQKIRTQLDFIRTNKRKKVNGASR